MDMKIYKFFCLVISCLLVSNVYSQWTSNTTVNTPVCLATGNQGGYDIYNPGVMFRSIPDGRGGMIIAWQDYRSGTNWDIYIQKLNENGIVQWATNGIIVCNASDDQYYFDMVSDGTGGAVLVWEDRRNISTTSRDIYAQRVNSSRATLWTSNGLIVCNEFNSQFEPSIIADGIGNSISGLPDELISYEIIYIHSKIVKKDSIDPEVNSIDIQILKPGLYQIIFSNQPRTFKLIKL